MSAFPNFLFFFSYLSIYRAHQPRSATRNTMFKVIGSNTEIAITPLHSHLPRFLVHSFIHSFIHSFTYWLNSLKDGDSSWPFSCVASHVKTTDWTFVKILVETYLCTRVNWLHFSRRPHLDPEFRIGGSGIPDLWIFERLFNTARYGIFHKLAHIAGKKRLYIHEKCIRDVTLYKEVPITLGSHPDSRSGLRIWTGFPLADVCTFWVLSCNVTFC